MLRTHRRLAGAVAATAALTLGLTACGSGSTDTAADSTDDAAASGETGTVTVESLELTDDATTTTEVEVTTPPTNVVVTDNNLFQTVTDWDIELVAAPRSLMPSTNPMREDEEIVDLGSHREPDLESIVAVEPGLIISGGRFAQFADDFAELVPDADSVNLGQVGDESKYDSMVRQTEAMGTIFGMEEEAGALVSDLDAAIERAKAAYDPEDTVMAVLTSGGEISYTAPSTGRTLGPIYDMLGLTPALEQEGSNDQSHGDDISVEAIAQSNPDIIMVMDRDAGIGANVEGEDYTPANQLLADSSALQNVTAVQDEAIYYMPQDTYTNESIQTYTEYINQLADAFEE
ncbi:siderophore ABC transporter substrate-binding protein [Brevibacterium litoralis]|uniref:siderophore ABC transporter substrate-binding protein n=1 Tax=Brevibacterium litoralis TaxID=3138935 RepID=UPI0032F08C6F